MSSYINKYMRGGLRVILVSFFLIIALAAALLGFSSIAGTAAGIAKILFGVFLVLLLVSLVMERRAV